MPHDAPPPTLGYQLGERPSVSAVRVCDCTLREGEETPGFTAFTLEQKLQFIDQLVKLGVQLIEVGTPGHSPEAKEMVRQLLESEHRARFVCIGRVLSPSYYEACIELGVPHVHIGGFTSEALFRHNPQLQKADVIRRSHDAVKLLHQNGIEVFFSLTDGSRADLGYLIELGRAVKEAGANALVMADSMGCSNPWAMRAQVAQLIEAVGLPMDVHAHNDFGLATANTLAAVMGGATQVEVTFNNFGARNGLAAAPEVVIALEKLFGIQTGIRTEYLAETARLLEALSGVAVAPGAPVVGANAFTHRLGMGLYTQGDFPADVLEHGLYEPATVGNERRILPS